jgi:hypothetical protein
MTSDRYEKHCDAPKQRHPTRETLFRPRDNSLRWLDRTRAATEGLTKPADGDLYVAIESKLLYDRSVSADQIDE